MSSPTSGGAAEADNLVVRAKSDREAMGRLYDRYYPIVHGYCSRRLQDGATADDVTSQVFLQVAANMRDFAGTTDGDFRCWVYRIATNAINAHLRQRIRRSRLFARAVRLGRWDPRDGAPAEAAAVGVDWDDVARAMHALKPREQAVLTLRYIEGLSYEEVAKVVGGRPATIRVVVSRALEHLRRRLLGPSSTRVARPGGGES